MGRIKSKLIKRTGKSLLGEVNNFTDNFKENNEILRGLFPSKKIRNQIAGYITRKLKSKKQ
ncbi:MAG: 30S ribosomal protein S17e [Nanoarchaeota archaeon]